MELFWTLLATTMALASQRPDLDAGPVPPEIAVSPAGSVVRARDTVVALALELRQAWLDRDRAAAVLDEAEARLEAARIEEESVRARGEPRAVSAHALARADERRRRALAELEAQEGRLGRAEDRLRIAERALDQAVARLPLAR